MTTRVESVDVIYPDGTTRITPDLSTRDVEVDLSYIDGMIGRPGLNAQQICDLLKRMMSPAVPNKDGTRVIVTVPPYRSDILHPCDIMEDAAIGYGFNKIKLCPPESSTVGKPLPMNKLSDLMRQQIAQAGFTEVLTLTLVCSRTFHELLLVFS